MEYTIKYVIKNTNENILKRKNICYNKYDSSLMGGNYV